ncbi:MAG: hypothetical protein KDK25_09130 [Leptospiraceae bacterium]|nr:hypothetical protein [Leptospiraceae bacterium]MCB1170483.1 hypothetical protein [Leptospiraceae bacterium]
MSCRYTGEWKLWGSTVPNGGSLTSTVIASMLYASDDAIYAAGEATLAGNDAGMILKSVDEGKSWSVEFTYQPSPGNTVFFTDIVEAPDGTLIATGIANPDGSNSEAFVATRPPGQSFSLAASYERLDPNDSQSLDSYVDSSGLHLAGNASDGTNAGTILDATAPYTTLQPRVFYNEPLYPDTIFSTIIGDSSGSLVAGIATDSSNYVIFLGRVDEVGTYSQIFREPIACCQGNPSLHDPNAIIPLFGDRYLISVTPGTGPADLRPQVWNVSTSSYSVITLWDATGAVVRLQQHGNRIVATSLIATPSATTGTPQVSISDDFGLTFRNSFSPDTDGIVLNDSPDSALPKIGTYALPDGSLLMPVPLDSALDANEPSHIYRLGCL